MIDPNQWQELEAHFQALIDLSAVEQERYLDAQCSDPEMRHALQKLLAAANTRDTGIAGVLRQEAEQTRWNEVAVGSLIGAYRIVGKIADGGMGSVYAAERADGAFEQSVAIKLLRQALPSQEAVERFRQERQVLANLEHPAIARLLDGGATEQGLPYLVMERVNGATIDRYAVHAQLSVRQRVQLFCQVCDAVQAAHQNLVVHRDIKPANILVDINGQPKLLDFGIAKLLGDEATNAGGLTQFGQQAMTPLYASPEQILGHKITTATDVYSLGVLLFELLTGVSPYQRWREKPLALQQAICETEPSRPSVTTPALDPLQAEPKTRKLTGKIDADLDYIVLKAMRKEPAQRYSSAAALVEDLQRYQDNLPILARRGTWRYRSGKYLRRNAYAVSASTLVLVGVAALITFYTWRVTQQRDVAEREQATAEQVSNFMVKLFNYANPLQQNPNTTARELLAAGTQHINQDLAAQPAIAVRLMITMGKAYDALGLFEESIATLGRAVDLGQSLPPDQSSVFAVAMMKYGESLYHVERWDEADVALNQAIALNLKYFGPQSDEYVESLLLLSGMQLRQHRRDAAVVDRAQKALAILQAQAQPNQELHSWAYTLIASWHKMNYRYAQALQLELKRREIAEQAFGKGHRLLVWLDENEGRLYWRLGDCRSAIHSFQQSVAQMEAFKGRDHADTAWSRYYLGICQQATGDYIAARDSFETLIPIEQDNLYYGKGRYLARALAGQAAVLIDLGLFELAAAKLKQSEKVMNDAFGPDDVEHFHDQFGWARWYQLQGQWPQAIEHWTRYVALRKRELAPEAPQIATGELRLADSLLSAAQLDAAAELVESSLPRLLDILGAKHPEYALGLGVRARLRAAQGDQEAALRDYTDALKALPSDQRDDLDVAVLIDGYLQLLEDHQPEKVAQLRRRAHHIRQRINEAASNT